MTKSIQDLREQRGALARELHARNETAKAWTAEDQSFYDAKIAQIDDIDAKIGRISALNERVASDALEGRAVEATARAVRDNGGDPRAVFHKWLRGGDKALNAGDWAAIQNTMSTTTNSEGGFTVATEVATSVLEALKVYGGMRAVADVIQTAQGNPINFPTSDGTSEVGELIGENTTATSADVTFGVKTLTTYKYSSKIVTVPYELLQDSSVDVEALVRNRLTTRLGRITNTHFTTGSGSSQPNGIVTASAVGKTGATGQTTSVLYADLIDLQHSVDPAYRENAKFMMNDATLRSLRKILDGQSRPIFVPGYEVGVPGGVPDTLLGSPLVVNQDVAVMAASAKSILFGDFSNYKIRDVMDVSLFRFTDSAYTKLGQVGFLAWMRSGGQFVDVGGSVKHYANSAT
jgi:HK97 family phage major capsid protein